MPFIKHVVVCFLVLATMAGCMRPEPVGTANIDPLGWRSADTVRFEITNKDTVSWRDLGFLLRFDNTFTERELTLTVRVTTPDSLWYEEGFTAVPTGRIRANNDFYETAVPYRNEVVLSREGAYVFEIVNTGDEVRGLWGLGLVTD